MALDIPNEQKDEQLDREHEDQKHKHEEKLREDAYHKRNDPNYHETKKAEGIEPDLVHFAEKGERREQDVTDAAIKETANTIFRGEE